MLLTLFLVFLVPVTLYCLVLGSFNRRWSPVVVSGVWDCLGLFFAASGFFLVVVPAMLHLTYLKTVREAAIEVDHLEDLWLGWWGIWLIYYGLLVSGAALILWFRRRKTVIYNVDVDDFKKHFAAILSRLGLEATHSGAHLLLRSASGEDSTQLLPEEGSIRQALPGKPAPASHLPSALVRIDPFPALAHVTLHWESANAPLRHEVERALIQALKHVQTRDNPAGSWILGIGGILLGFGFLIILVLVMIAYFPPRRW
ncbi:MAG: hypothetical protein FJ271_05280 [Planctomycetes bacterium]|nr:hypothetical protein [Planctomycetota bacterium]